MIILRQKFLERIYSGENIDLNQLNPKDYLGVYYYQKEFGIVSSGISKLRKVIANQIDKSIARDIAKNQEIVNQIKSREPVIGTNPRVRRKLHEIGLENNARVNIDKSLSQSNGTLLDTEKVINALLKKKNTEGLKREELTRLNNLQEDLKNGISSQIYVGEGSSGETIAHEIGHAMNKNSGGRIARNHKKGLQSLKELTSATRDVIEGKDTSSDIAKIPNRLLGQVRLISEERRANKNGLLALKRSGASKEELNKIRKDYKNDVKSYKINRLSWKGPIRDKLKGGSE